MKILRIHCARQSCSILSTALDSVAAICLFLASGLAAAADCQGLTNKTFGAARIIETSESTGPMTVTSLDGGSLRGVPVQAVFCRVRGMIAPTPSSDIRFEVWLPKPDAWNGRYQGIGNGGHAGNMQFPAMARGLDSGYAVSATDTGHVGSTSESGYAIGQPEKLVDFGWRAIHETALAAKAVVNTYYGRPAARSYFNGCSTGGRQGLVEAQRFADDYDGIVIGAPANYWPLQNASGLRFFQTLMSDPGNWISPDKLALVNTASLAACKGIDGVVDDPGQCTFDPSPLQCKPGQTDDCLTAKEVGSVREMYAAGFPPGNESVWSVWKMGPSERRVTGALSFVSNSTFYRDLVMQDPNWDVKTFDFAADLSKAQHGPVGQAVHAESPDLSAFEKRGGKLIHYHGWHDPAIPARSSIRYYESVATQMGGSARLDSFYRLFLGTGMSHCSGGAGPNAINGASGLPAPSRDPQHDVVEALVNWVEKGAAPAQITATQYVGNDPAKGVARQRPWCPYPAVARYSGSGDPNKASSYSCMNH